LVIQTSFKPHFDVEFERKKAIGTAEKVMMLAKLRDLIFK
jgi:hypothetical protein